jgi:1-acyl-sn-glycerol-3-phosphate acyltransferase
MNPSPLPDQAATARKRLYWIGRGLFALLFRHYFRWQVAGAENVPTSGPVILVANHQSYIDPGAVGAAVSREVFFLARETAFRPRGIGSLLRRVNAIPVDLQGGAMSGLRAGLDVLHKGHALMLFPEGTRTRDGAIQDFRSGIGLIVAKSGAPVVPVRISGLFEAYGRHLRVPRRRPVSLTFGPPLHFRNRIEETRNPPGQSPRELYQMISDELKAAVAGLQAPNDR